MSKADKTRCPQEAKTGKEDRLFGARVCVRLTPQAIYLGNLAMELIPFNDRSHALNTAMIDCFNRLVPDEKMIPLDTYTQMVMAKKEIPKRLEEIRKSRKSRKAKK